MKLSAASHSSSYERMWHKHISWDVVKMWSRIENIVRIVFVFVCFFFALWFYSCHPTDQILHKTTSSKTQFHQIQGVWTNQNIWAWQRETRIQYKITLTGGVSHDAFIKRQKQGGKRVDKGCSHDFLRKDIHWWMMMCKIKRKAPRNTHPFICWETFTVNDITFLHADDGYSDLPFWPVDPFLGMTVRKRE